MIFKAMKPFKLFPQFLTIVMFDFLIGNTDRHQSNWGLILRDKKFELCPMYDNSSSLCAYVLEEKIPAYLGKDLKLWNSLIDTKSRSRIRIGIYDGKEPTHLEVLKAIKECYYEETSELAKYITANVTEEKIANILAKHEDRLISLNRKKLIQNFLLAKIEMLKEVYEGKE